MVVQKFTLSCSFSYVSTQPRNNDKTRLGGEDGVLAAVCPQAKLSLFQLILAKYKQPDLHMSTYSLDIDANTFD